MKGSASTARRARRRWGQHFLSDRRACQRIIEAFAPSAGDGVLEIGPGRGALTRLLAGAVRSLVAVEIDERLAEDLRRSLAGFPSVEVLPGDILETDLAGIARKLAPPGGRIRVIGNLPFSIATAVVQKLLRTAHLLSNALLMTQKEVAARLLADAGSREYGYISVLVALTCRGRPVLELPPGAFRPPPKVRASVIALEFPQSPALPLKVLDSVENLLKRAFAQRRKMLVNALRSLSPSPSPDFPAKLREMLRLCGAPENARPEQLTPGQYVELSRLLHDSPFL